MASSFIHRARRLGLSPLLACAALAGGLAYTAGAQAESWNRTLADVRLVDRNSGQAVSVYEYKGEYWVAGRPGASYSVDITNRTGERILAVVSVDGVNAITGKSAAAAPKDGYVFDPRRNWAITGWRKSDSQVAAFYFSESDASYASRTGRPRDVGVIGVALFRERVAPVVRPLPPPVSRNAPMVEEREYIRSNSDSQNRVEAVTADAAAAAAAPAAPAPAAAATAQAAPAAAESAQAAKPRMAESNADRATKRSSASPTLGTGHGALETSYTTDVEFEAANNRPAQTVRIRYDSYANLVARGVIREPRPRPSRPRAPNPFPGDNGFVPDPPRN